MPRFLALDYWEEREEIIREKTSRLWLFVPEIKHLSQQYLQSSIQLNAYHTPWTRVASVSEEVDIYDDSPESYLQQLVAGNAPYSEETLEPISDSVKLKYNILHEKSSTDFEGNSVINLFAYNVKTQSGVDRNISKLEFEYMFNLENPLRKLCSSLPLRSELQMRLKPKAVLDPLSEEDNDACEYSWIQERHENVRNDLFEDSTGTTFAALLNSDCNEYPFRFENSKVCIDKLQLDDAYIENRYFESGLESANKCNILVDILNDANSLEAMPCNLETESCLMKVQDTMSSFVEPYENNLEKDDSGQESEGVDLLSNLICINDLNIPYCKNDAYRLKMKLDVPLVKNVDHTETKIDVPQLCPMPIDDLPFHIYTQQACEKLPTLQPIHAEACTLNMDNPIKDKCGHDKTADCVIQSMNFAQMVNELKELNTGNEDIQLSWNLTFQMDLSGIYGDTKNSSSFFCTVGLKNFDNVCRPSSYEFEKDQNYTVTPNISKVVGNAREGIKPVEMNAKSVTFTDNAVLKRIVDAQMDTKKFSSEAHSHLSAPLKYENNNMKAKPILPVASNKALNNAVSITNDICIDQPGLTVTSVVDKVRNERRPYHSVLNSVSISTPFVSTTASSGKISDFDPCDQFLSMLSSGVEEHAQHPGGNTSHIGSSVAIVMPHLHGSMLRKSSGSMATSIERDHQNLPVTATGKNDDKNSTSSISELVEVKLSEFFIKILLEVSEVAIPMLEKLKQLQLVANNTNMKTLKPDLTGFILRQCQVEQSHGRINEDALATSLAVHALVICIDLIENVSLQHAVQQLNFFVERYGSMCATLQTVHKQFSEISCEHRDKDIQHPKVVRLHRIISEHFSSCAEDFSPKILVLLKEYCMPFCLELVRYVSSIDGICIGIVPEKAANTEAISRMFVEHNCLIAVPGKMSYSSSFLQQLSLFIEYRHTAVSGWKSMCCNAGVNFVSMKTCPVEFDLFSSCKSNQEAVLCRSDTVKPQSIDESRKKPIILIASRSVTQNNQLLCALEVKENVLLIDRDYTEIRSSSKSLIHFEDIALDGQSCIVLCNLHQLQTADELQQLTVKISALSVKFNKCWVIILPSNEPHDSTVVTSNVSKLIGTSTVLSDKSENFTVKIVHCHSVNEAARRIRLLSENSKAIDVSLWLEQNLFAREPTMQETFLLAIFPCLNSFTAQLMLHKFDGSVRRLTSMSGVDLAENFPEIPPLTCERFSNLCCSNKVLTKVQQSNENGFVELRNSEAHNVQAIDQLNIKENLMAPQVQLKDFIRVYAVNSANCDLSLQSTSMPGSSASLQNEDVQDTYVDGVSEKASNMRYSQCYQLCNEKPQFTVELDLSYDEYESDKDNIIDNDGYICSPFIQSQRMQNEFERAIQENRAINRSIEIPSTHYRYEQFNNINFKNSVEYPENYYQYDNSSQRSDRFVNVESRFGHEFSNNTCINKSSSKGESSSELYFAKGRNDSMNSSCNSPQTTLREVALIAPFNPNPVNRKNTDCTLNGENLFSYGNDDAGIVPPGLGDETSYDLTIGDGRQRYRNTSTDGAAATEYPKTFQYQENLWYPRTSNGIVSSTIFSKSNSVGVSGRLVSRAKTVDGFTFNDMGSFMSSDSENRREMAENRPQLIENTPQLAEYKRRLSGISGNVTPAKSNYTPNMAFKRQMTHSGSNLEMLKKRKLTYIKDGSLKGGQTRLSFR